MDGNFNHANLTRIQLVGVLQLPIPTPDVRKRKRVGVLTGANSVL